MNTCKFVYRIYKKNWQIARIDDATIYINIKDGASEID